MRMRIAVDFILIPICLYDFEFLVNVETSLMFSLQEYILLTFY